jgi:hypothetical protein
VEAGFPKRSYLNNNLKRDDRRFRRKALKIKGWAPAKTAAASRLKAFGPLPISFVVQATTGIFRQEPEKSLKAARQQARPHGGRVHPNSRSMEDFDDAYL